MDKHKSHRSSKSEINVLLCDECYHSFDIELGADKCNTCDLFYCHQCIHNGVMLQQNNCSNCGTDKLNVFDYITIAKYLLHELNLDGRKLAHVLKNYE
jgi:hypothetical protein